MREREISACDARLTLVESVIYGAIADAKISRRAKIRDERGECGWVW